MPKKNLINSNKRRLIKIEKTTALFLILFSLIIISRLSFAFTTSDEENPSDSSQIESLGSDEPMELEFYLDEFINKKMEEYHIPGLVFVMVKDGAILLSKGYGYADVEEKISVKPEETIFRVGSVSKLFTATAVMQLYEQGRLDLNKDVNEYLKLFKLEDNYPKPVTPAHLLTHTAGFRGRAFRRYTRQPSERKPIGEYLVNNMTPRSLPPGSVINYSNHGFYLAGRLVEVISGLTFDQYVAENILSPLGMEKSSFIMPSHLTSSLAKGYQYRNGQYQVVAKEFPIPKPSPPGSLIASAEDMAHFMIAQLQGGHYENQRILNESTCREMQKQQFTNDRRLPGTCYGFYEYENYNQRAIMHDGDVSGFSSRLFLLLEHNLGFFVCNNTSNSILRMELTDHLMSRYFKRSEEPPLKQTTADGPSVGKRLTGCYRSISIGLDSFDKLSYTGAVWKITENTVNSLIEIEPGLFQFPRSKTKMTYREDDNGNIKYLHMDAKQMPITYEKLAWYENYLRFPRVWFGIFAVVFFWIGLIRPVFYRIRSRRKTIIGTSNLAKYTKLSATVISDIYLIFIVGFAPAFILSEEQISFGIPWVISALLVLPLINLVLTAVFIIFFIRSWKDKYWDLKKRLYYVLMALLFIGFAFCLNYWNLLGFQY